MKSESRVTGRDFMKRDSEEEEEDEMKKGASA